MANRDEVKGAECYGPCLRQNAYEAAGTIYQGDFVKQDSGGGVVAGTAGAPSLGVAMNYAVSGGTVMVADHPDQLFVIQADDGTVAALTNIGLNYNFIAGSANTTYRRSGMELDGDTGASDSNLNLRLLRLHPAVDNAYGANCKCIVKIQSHQHSGIPVIGIGV